MIYDLVYIIQKFWNNCDFKWDRNSEWLIENSMKEFIYAKWYKSLF